MHAFGKVPSGWSVALSAALAWGCLAGVAGAQSAAKGTMTDAQIEANVLRALASATELSTQNIQSSTVYGTVTLSGNVHDEALRTRAEELVSRTDGVKKVIDELALGDTPSPAGDDPAQANLATGIGEGNAANAPGQVLQSDGSYAPGQQQAQGGASVADQTRGAPDQGPPPSAQGSQNAPYGYGQPGTPMPQPNGQDPYGPRQPYARAPYPTYPPAYGQNGRSAYGSQPGYGPGPGNYDGSGSTGGQVAGIAATVPSGTNLQVRIDRGIDSNHIQPGTNFTGTVLNDVNAGGVIAVPRGAAVEGIVVDAKRAGALKGEGELALQLTTVTLGGQVYTLSTTVWDRAGRDKTLGTVNTALGLGALGAVFGGLAGGGAGAAIGAGVGGAVGIGASAASPGGRVIVPPESVLTFSLAQPLALRTVSQGEMQRLAYTAGPGPNRQVVVRRRYYPGYAPYGPYGAYGGYGPYGYPYGGYFYRR